MSHRFFSVNPAARVRAAAVTSALALALVAGCTAEGDAPSAETAADDPPAGGAQAANGSSDEPTVTVTTSVRDGARQVPVDEPVTVDAEGGTLKQVTVTVGGTRKTLRGTVAGDGSAWETEDRLEPGTRYRVASVAVDDEGRRVTSRSSFRTETLTLDEQTFPSIAPLEGQTVGVGMPVIVRFDVPVRDRANIEKHLSVTTTPAQSGSWSWLSDTEVHWRPRTFWKAGTEVTVDADINSVSAGRGIYGQHSRSTSFTIGAQQISKIDIARHQMKVFRNGALIRTIPVTAGKDGFVTRSGIKVIMEKERLKVMDAATIGISPGDPEYYRLDVPYAMRVTYTGEFVHGAPWSTGDQGSDNVSHGCVGMSMDNAAWFYGRTQIGDVVKVTGSDRELEPGNGYTDWNVSFAEYRAGSALS